MTRFTEHELHVARSVVRSYESRCELLRQDMEQDLQAALKIWDDNVIRELWDEVV